MMMWCIDWYISRRHRSGTSSKYTPSKHRSLSESSAQEYLQCIVVIFVKRTSLSNLEVNSFISSDSWYACRNTTWPQGYRAPNFNYDRSELSYIRGGLISMRIKYSKILNVRFIESFLTIQNGEAGYPSPYVSHAKRVLYHVSYITIVFELVHILLNKLCFWG